MDGVEPRGAVRGDGSLGFGLRRTRGIGGTDLDFMVPGAQLKASCHWYHVSDEIPGASLASCHLPRSTRSSTRETPRC
ncbi:hypothetical protein AHiyo8_13780 [Arthrobacter sp. Hiyo8]|nr:hypothetical protein AHiyo8_13780 [Arthrobacter sp. Hiyo8]